MITILAITLFAEQLMRNVFVGSKFTQTTIQREHAQMLALGGINIAIATLSIDSKGRGGEQKKSHKAQDKKDKLQGDQAKAKSNVENSPGYFSEKAAKRFIASVLPYLNRWRTFKFEQVVDGFDGVVKICITAESGKINLNEAFDFEKQDFKEAPKLLLMGLGIPGILKEGEILKNLTEFLKKRERKLDDISQLSQVQGLEGLDLWYQPPRHKPVEGILQPNKPLMLQDIFTLWTDDETVDPLVFSDSLCAIFGVRRPRAGDARELKESFKQLSTKFSGQWYENWDESWKNLQPIYEEKPKFLKKVAGIFSKKFGPQVYSVLSCGKVGGVEQKIIAIIRQTQKPKNKKQSDGQSDEAADTKRQTKNQEKEESAKSSTYFKVEKIYWL